MPNQFLAHIITINPINRTDLIHSAPPSSKSGCHCTQVTQHHKCQIQHPIKRAKQPTATANAERGTPRRNKTRDPHLSRVTAARPQTWCSPPWSPPAPGLPREAPSPSRRHLGLCCDAKRTACAAGWAAGARRAAPPAHQASPAPRGGRRWRGSCGCCWRCPRG